MKNVHKVHRGGCVYIFHSKMYTPHEKKEVCIFSILDFRQNLYTLYTIHSTKNEFRSGGVYIVYIFKIFFGQIHNVHTHIHNVHTIKNGLRNVLVIILEM